MAIDLKSATPDSSFTTGAYLFGADSQSASSPSVYAIADVAAYLAALTQTLTNKTLTSPVMTTPTLGVATATSINKVAITAPATSATLTIADGKTVSFQNSLTFPSSAGTSGYVLSTDGAGTLSWVAQSGGGGGSGTVTSVGVTAPAAGITSSGGPITSSGSITLALANDLAALEGLASTGLAARTGSDTWAQRTITGTSNEVTVTNGDGVSGNPTLSLPSAITLTGKTLTGGTFSSPSLTTPALGTPSSGTLTSCTGLPVSTGISGLGSGIATFLATPSSANLASAVTDETGSGALVFANSPTLVTPTLGVATVTSVNKVAITAPATSATLTIADGKTVSFQNSLTFPSSAGTSGYVLSTDGAGTLSWVAQSGGGGSPAGSSGNIQYNNAGSFGGAAALAYATSGDILTATAQSATDKPLVVKGAASQSATLQEWRNSSNTVLSSVTKDGYFAAAQGSSSAPSIYFPYSTTAATGFFQNGSGSEQIGVLSGGTICNLWISNQIRLGVALTWGSSLSALNSQDTGLTRAAAAVISCQAGTVTTGATFRYTPDRPAQITADQNNYTAASGRSKYQFWNTDAARNITGLSLSQVDGQEHVIVNIGSNNIVLVHQSASSTAANRFLNATGADITLSANQAADLVYDNTQSRWLVFKRN